MAILDESHEMKSNIIAKSIEQSQSSKEEPIFINITTEGFVENGYLDHIKSEHLNPVLLSSVLENGIRNNNDERALSAFNCFM